MGFEWLLGAGNLGVLVFVVVKFLDFIKSEANDHRAWSEIQIKGIQLVMKEASASFCANTEELRRLGRKIDRQAAALVSMGAKPADLFDENGSEDRGS